MHLVLLQSNRLFGVNLCRRSRRSFADLSKKLQDQGLVFDGEKAVRWRSMKLSKPPRRVVVQRDAIAIEKAIKLVSTGSGLLWRGDYVNANLLLQGMKRRLDPNRPKPKIARYNDNRRQRNIGLDDDSGRDLKDLFHQIRLRKATRARKLDMLLIPFEKDHKIPLDRAPDVSEACQEVFGDLEEPYALSLNELLGIIGAHEWRKKGIQIHALKEQRDLGNCDYDRIHPYHGVFSPLREDYLSLVAETPLPTIPNMQESEMIAYDIGTGTGVLAAILASRGIGKIHAVDIDHNTLDCAYENVVRLKMEEKIEVMEGNLYPEDRALAHLIVCNPPWIPAKPASILERSVYDHHGEMLMGFLKGLRGNLRAGGEGWLILSDLAELLGLRTRDELLGAIDGAGLTVVERNDRRPARLKAVSVTINAKDPLYELRMDEVVSLWRLRPSSL